MDKIAVSPVQVRTSVSVELGTEARPVLIRWANWAPRWGSQERASYAILTDEGPILIDPAEPATSAGQRLRRLIGRRPVATVLTSDQHERDCYRIRDGWGTPVWAPAAGLRERGGDLDGQPDDTFEDGDTLPGGLRAIKIDGGWIRGETALAWRAPTGQRVLFTGDALNGRCDPEQPNPYYLRRTTGLYVGVRRRYLERLADPICLQAGLRRLLAEDFDLVCGAHGVPYCSDAKGSLAQLLAMDWSTALVSGGLPCVLSPSA